MGPGHMWGPAWESTGSPVGREPAERCLVHVGPCTLMPPQGFLRPLAACWAPPPVKHLFRVGQGPLASRTAVGPSVAPHCSTVAFHPPALDGGQPAWTRPSARPGGEGQGTRVALQGTGDGCLGFLFSTPCPAPCAASQAGRRRSCPVSPCSFCRTRTTHTHTHTHTHTRTVTPARMPCPGPGGAALRSPCL